MEGKQWLLGTVVEEVEYRKYKVKLANGAELIRNRIHLRITEEVDEGKYEGFDLTFYNDG